MEYLIYIIVAVVAFWAGWHIRAAVILAHMSVNPEKMIGILKQIQQINQKEAQGLLEPQLAQRTGTELRIELHGGVLYAYTMDQNEFIAQGPDLQTLLATAQQRFPNREFFGEIAKDNPAKEFAVKS